MYLTSQSVFRRAIVAFAFTLASVSVHAAGAQPYDAKAFQAAQAAGGPVLVEFFASWCPVCKEQGELIDKISADPKFSSITRFKVDVDAQKAVLKTFHVKSRGTLILYKGNKEVARNVFETDEAPLRAMFGKAS
jgi:thiol-disulfide isomerase/thioredoxin